MNGNQILVEAKKEYTKSLCGRLMPHLIETFVQMYEEAKKMSKGKNVLLQYQELLKDVKQLNNNMIKKIFPLLNLLLIKVQNFLLWADR